MSRRQYHPHEVVQAPQERRAVALAVHPCRLSVIEREYLAAHNWTPVDDHEAGTLWRDPTRKYSPAYEGATALLIQRRRDALGEMSRDGGAL